jgi:ornithine--oxo-acid transaminase
VETAIKLCRRWAYDVKSIEDNQAKILVCSNNFHGRTSTVISFSTDPSARRAFGPYMHGFEVIPYNDLTALQEALDNDANIAGFLIEPIQGEAGIKVPSEGYLAKAAAACKTANVLFIADEIQTGLCRTGKMLCCDHENVRPDILILGKALSGGTMPVSAVLADDEIMMTIKPGEHGSTYGGNPLACKVAIESLQVLKDEHMGENAEAMGIIFREELRNLNAPQITDIRGKGLLNAIELVEGEEELGWNICLKLMEKGLLAKPTHSNKIRLAPPLVITKEEIYQTIDIINDVISNL